MEDEIACVINKVIPLSENVVDFLKFRNDELDNTKNKTKGGVFSDTRYCWFSNGSRLEILLTRSGVKMATWIFGAVLNDNQTQIINVIDIPRKNKKPPYAIVALNCELTGGMLCVFDIISSRVVRSIQIDDQISSICVVDGGFDTPLPGILRSLDGVIAIGTVKGKILLVDLCRQMIDEAIASNGLETLRDELRPCRLVQISLDDLTALEKHKELSVKTGDHLCVQLNEFCTSGPHFVLKGPEGEDRAKAYIEEVIVSALNYSVQLGSLLVGFNFGAFQIYNLLSINLEFTSPIYEDCIPITHFAMQEPSNDPRAFCYLWTVHSQIENDETGFPMAIMYAVAYNNKEYLEGYGYLYQEFVSCSIRFETELTALPGTKVQNPVGARCLALRSYSKGIFNKCITLMQDINEDHLALCSVIWEVWGNDTKEIFLCLFDLNQWYKEQMPRSPKHPDHKTFMVFISLTNLFTPATHFSSRLLDVRLDPSRINQFTSVQHLEEHYYPNALSYKCICMREDDIIWLQSSGVQRHLLSLIDRAGPLCLLNPSEIFQNCVSLGLTPSFMDVTNSNISQSVQRELILSVALENQLISWLCQCAQDWSNGSQSSGGCTLDFLLSWAWHRASILKFNANKLCVSLFDYSGLRLDANSQKLLTHYTCQLKHLATLYGVVVGKCTWHLTEEDIDEITQQWKALQMISVYLEVLQWLLNVGLLPECPLSMYPRADEADRMSAPYPVESLEKFYRDRRQKLNSLQGKTPSIETDSCNLLFIDNLINIECGGKDLHQQWINDDGNGLYPPPSLQALLRTYLIEDINIVHKHSIFIYFFLDLAMTLDHSRYNSIITHLIKFPAVFRISPSIIKITQAFWQIDHGDFSTAMAQLLDPLVKNEDLKPWHHRVALKSLLAQGHYQHALLYQQVRKPPLHETEDLCLMINLLTVNNLVQEAFHFQRQHHNSGNSKKLLRQFFEVCKKTDQLIYVLQLSLTSMEEESFVDFLKSNTNEENENLLIFYYLYRSRYGEAFDVNEMFHFNELKKQGLVGQHEVTFRDVILSGVQQGLPKILQTLIEHCKKLKKTTWTKVDQPTPMSVYIHDNKEKVKYKSTLLAASLAKAKETWDQETLNEDCTIDEMPFLSSPKALPLEKKMATPVIYASLKNLQENDSDGPTPSKRMKLMARPSIGSESVKSDTSVSETQKFIYHSQNSLSLLNTPIVKRRNQSSTSVCSVREGEEFSVGTPASILKVRNLVRSSVSPLREREYSVTPELIENQESDSDIQPLDTPTADRLKSKVLSLNKKKTSPLGVSARRSIQRTPKPVVRFDVDKSTSLSDNSMEKMEVDIEATPKRSTKVIPVEVEKLEESPLKVVPFEITIETPKLQSHKRTSPVDVEKLEKSYSKAVPVDITIETPKLQARKRTSSPVDVEKLEKSYPKAVPVNITIETPKLQARKRTSSPVDVEKLEKSYLKAVPVDITIETPKLQARKRTSSLVEVEKLEKSPPKVTPFEITIETPKLQSRKRTLRECDEILIKTPPQVTKSPRRTPSKLKTLDSAIKSRRSYKTTPSLTTVEAEILEDQSDEELPTKIDVVPKIGARKSLSRQVLEQNTFNQALSSPRIQTRLSASKTTSTPLKKHAIGVETSIYETTKSKIIVTSMDKDDVISNVSKIESKNYYSTQTDPEISEQIIKLDHKESINIYNYKQTDVLESDNEASIPDMSVSSVNILDSSCSFDESFAEKIRPKIQNILKTNLDITFSTPLKDDTLQNDITNIEKIQNEITESLTNVEKDKEDEITIEKQTERLMTEEKPVEITNDLSEARINSEIEITDDLSNNDEIGKVIEVCVDVHMSQTENNMCELKNVITTEETMETVDIEDKDESYTVAEKSIVESIPDMSPEDVLSSLSSPDKSLVKKFAENIEDCDTSLVVVEDSEVFELEPVEGNTDGPINVVYEKIGEENIVVIEEDDEDMSPLKLTDSHTDFGDKNLSQPATEEELLEKMSNQEDSDEEENVSNKGSNENSDESNNDFNLAFTNPNLGDLSSEEEEDQINEEYEEVDLEGEDTSDEDKDASENGKSDSEIEEEEKERLPDIVEIQSSDEEKQSSSDESSDDDDESSPEFEDHTSTEEVAEEQKDKDVVISISSNDTLKQSTNEVEGNQESISGNSSDSEKLQCVASDLEKNISASNSDVIENEDTQLNISETQFEKRNSIINSQENISDSKLSDENIVEYNLDITIEEQQPEQKEKRMLDGKETEISQEIPKDSLEKTMPSKPVEESFREDILDVQLDRLPKIQKSSTNHPIQIRFTNQLFIPEQCITTRSSSRLSQKSEGSTPSKILELPKKRTLKRSASVDLDFTPKQNQKRSMRSASLEPQDIVPKRRSRAQSISSVASLAPIEESDDEDVLNSTKKRKVRTSKSKIDEIKTGCSKNLSEIEKYSESHRLTRSQKLIIEKSLEIQERSKNVAPEHQVCQEEEEESQEGEESPIIETATEQDPDGSLISTSTYGSRVDRPRRRSFTLAQQALSTPPKTRRTRTNSQDSDISDTASNISISSVPVVVLYSIDKRENDRFGTRHRSLSPKLLNKESDTLSPLKAKRSARTSILPKKIELEQIEEESVSTEKTAKPKRGRPKKIKETKPESEEDETKCSTTSTKRQSYETRSLQPYLPKHLIHKRRTMSVKRFLRRSNKD